MASHVSAASTVAANPADEALRSQHHGAVKEIHVVHSPEAPKSMLCCLRRHVKIDVIDKCALLDSAASCSRTYSKQVTGASYFHDAPQCELPVVEGKGYVLKDQSFGEGDAGDSADHNEKDRHNLTAFGTRAITWLPSFCKRGLKHEASVLGFRASTKNIFVQRSVLEELVGHLTSPRDDEGLSFRYMHLLLLDPARSNESAEEKTKFQRCAACTGHWFLAFAKKDRYGDGPLPSLNESDHAEDVALTGDSKGPLEVILVELLAQPQVVDWLDKQHGYLDNRPISIIDSVKLNRLGKGVSLHEILSFLVRNDTIHDYHMWNQWAHLNFRKTFNDCIHMSCRMWNHFCEHYFEKRVQGQHVTDALEGDTAQSTASVFKLAGQGPQWFLNKRAHINFSYPRYESSGQLVHDWCGFEIRIGLVDK